MNEFVAYREEIDKIDKELTQLFEKRMDVAFKVALFKKQNNLQILDKTREEEVVRKAIDRLQNKDYQDEVIDFFNHLMSISKDFQSKKMLTVQCPLTVCNEPLS